MVSAFDPYHSNFRGIGDDEGDEVSTLDEEDLEEEDEDDVEDDFDSGLKEEW